MSQELSLVLVGAGVALAGHSDPKTTQQYFHNLARAQAGAERYISF